MATQAAYQEQHSRLNSMVRQWDRRQRWQQSIFWLPRSLLPGLIIGVVLFFVARFTPLPPAPQLAVLTALLVLAGLLIMLGAVWLRARSSLDVARHFDLRFKLDERISTALELIEGRISASDELTGYQIDDAWQRGQTVDARRELPLANDQRAWVAVVIALILLVILYVLPNPQTPVDAQMAARQAAIDEASEAVERITEQVAGDTALSDEDRQALLEQLDKTNEILEQEEVTAEEALAALSEAEAELQEQGETLSQTARQQQASAQQAAQQLRESAPGMGQQQAQQEQQEAIPTLQELAESMGEMTAEQREQLADALEQAAEQLEQTNPEAAQALREAAEALRNGDMEAARQAMQEAMDSLQQQAQQNQQQQQAAQNLQQNAQQLQQSAGQVAQQSQQGQQQAGQQPDSQQQGQQQSGQQDSGIQPLQQPGQQSGEQQGQAQSQQSQQGQPQAGQSGQQEGQPGDQPGQQPGQQASEQQGQTQSQQSSAGAGAGDQQGNAGEDNAVGAPGGEVDQNNDPDGEGVGQFDPVYAPRRAGGEGGPEIVLQPDSSNVPVQEGEFTQNPSGQSLVPYNQVIGEYSEAANRSLESDYIPLGLRDVIRDYFSSLEPGQ